MKVVVSCDAIVDRDYYLETVEAALDVIGEQCELYTLVHNHGSIVGPVEARKIHSSFLSHKVKTWRGLLKNSFLIPSAAKNLYISCSNDLIINISRGFSHGIKKCDKSKLICFVVDDINNTERQKAFKEKIFSLFVRSFQKKSFDQVDELWASNKEFLPKSQQERARIFHPPVKLTDYKLLPDAMFNRDYILINVESINLEKAKSIYSSLIQGSIKFKFIGKDDHLEELKNQDEQYFFGNRCGGEMAPLLAGCLYLVDFDRDIVPTWALKTMASGRPVFSFGNSFLEFQEGFFKASENILREICATPDFDRNDLRGIALSFEELKFKHLIKKIIQQHSTSQNVSAL